MMAREVKEYYKGFLDGRRTAQVAAAARSIDADRMKQAIINVICGWQDEEHCGEDARAIAAEYDRLDLIAILKER